ncbi:AraC-like DNA-binding protein [Salinibacter ruber]|jgi:AraC-like DNA-binding protein|uniref:AraC-like DNA-binding protein n=1 Tax=Salinibacter ruber TaxID=146919 RepID=A0A9X2U0K4_9BACT|nr:AraC family transcriptional regulator [Salinibacter ruber]MCS3627285.1 AraC-like DNA-binding protein [Salinibacter ruber]MCS3644210.1 AraC-like DNA-binding protein [Salinibacter ruber]MCS3655728.1 AraC-like DNA-binding protein [Salinibacter ruber]MCS3667352.1 AraC-like DNA-binding protein [Salinibacter ruber]MCS3676776.1 AraC-like DNA-binding protein [Salinibacter ruber]
MSRSFRPTPYGEASESLVNYRLGVGGDDARLSFYAVEESARGVSLRAPHLTYYGLVDGTARVDVEGEEGLAVEAGESLVVPPLQTITVDFPAAHEDPARYVVLRIDRSQVRSILDRVASDVPSGPAVQDGGRDDPAYFHVPENEGIARVLNMVAYLFREDPPNRDRLIDLNAMELLIQMLQTASRPLLVGELPRNTSAGGLAAAVQYIQDNLDRHISIDELVEEACMSKSSFYRHFSDEFEMSPLEYITRERVVRARELLADSDNTVTNVSHALGFSSTSHFIDMFKEHEGVTPKQYQMDLLD